MEGDDGDDDGDPTRTSHGPHTKGDDSDDDGDGDGDDKDDGDDNDDSDDGDDDDDAGDGDDDNDDDDGDGSPNAKSPSSKLSTLSLEGACLSPRPSRDCFSSSTPVASGPMYGLHSASIFFGRMHQARDEYSASMLSLLYLNLAIAFSAGSPPGAVAISNT